MSLLIVAPPPGLPLRPVEIPSRALIIGQHAPPPASGDDAVQCDVHTVVGDAGGSHAENFVSASGDVADEKRRRGPRSAPRRARQRRTCPQHEAFQASITDRTASTRCLGNIGMSSPRKRQSHSSPTTAAFETGHAPVRRTFVIRRAPERPYGFVPRFVAMVICRHTRLHPASWARREPCHQGIRGTGPE
jgi:hypothetical protein